LTDWGSADDRARHGEAAFVSILLHIAGITALLLMPKSLLSPVVTAVQHTVTPLIAPLMEPTQRTPNKGPLSKEFNAEALRAQPRIHIPPSPPSTSRAAALRPSLRPSLPSPPPSLAEPPKLDAAARPAQAPVFAPTPQVAPPPQIQAQEKPKLVLENPSAAPTSPTGRMAPPGNTIQEAIRSAARGGSGGGLVVGDIGGAPGIGGIGEGINMPPSPGRQASNLELLSDPMGVDFRPYLIKILAAVRRNWFAVMPEAARLGRAGRVGIQFAVARDGSVPKLVIVTHSGTDALDRAAVAGISASNPFPPLPAEFRGQQVRLQFNFQYNIPRN
jgi:TonB family protein